jgi:TPR repeat protein
MKKQTLIVRGMSVLAFACWLLLAGCESTPLGTSPSTVGEPKDAEAQFRLGYAYYAGNGVEKDAEKTVYWLTKAAEQGHARAQAVLGFYYKNGEGVAKDLGKAVYWHTKAAEQGHAKAQETLADLQD